MAAPQVAGPAPGGRRLLKDSVASLLDQGMLSALNLALGLVLIRLTTKENYGLYSQLYVAGILIGTLIESVITAPLTTLAPGMEDERRKSFIGHLAWYQRRLAALLALLSGAIAGGVAGLWQLDPHPVALGVAFALYVGCGCLREFSRSIGFIEGRAVGVLRMDLWFGLALTAGMGALAWAGRMSLPAVLAVMAVANLAAVSLRPMAGGGDRAGRVEALKAVWQRGRWSLPGAMLAWLTNYSYLYLTALWLGVAASADLNASRLLLMPVSLLMLAWSRVARPHTARLLRQHDMAAVRRFTFLSVGAMELVTVVYAALLWLLLPFLETHVLGPKYSGLEPLVLAWGVYFVLYTGRWIGTSLLTSGDRFRMLLASSVLCLVVMVAAAGYALPRWGAWGAVAALAVVELIDLLLVWLVLLPRVQRDLHARAALPPETRLP